MFQNMKILLTGGGTIGSVSPLLAISQELKKSHPEIEFLFLGSGKSAAEKELVANYQIPFKIIFNGKLRRYFSLLNFIDPFFIFLGFIQSFFILLKFKPNLIISAGSFVSVPVVWAGWILKIPSLIHQQDAVPGLANKLMARVAKKTTVTFEESLRDFSSHKTVWTGNLIREDIIEGSNIEANKLFNLERDLPVILVIGGGTGALFLNKLIVDALPELTEFCQIIHLTGENIANQELQIKNCRYHPYQFLNKEIKDVYAVADLVITRAGMSALTEISFLGKPAIIIPMPSSHQEKNAEIFTNHNAALVLDQNRLNAGILIQRLKNLFSDEKNLRELSRNIKNTIRVDNRGAIVNEILKIIEVEPR